MERRGVQRPAQQPPPTRHTWLAAAALLAGCTLGSDLDALSAEYAQSAPDVAGADSGTPTPEPPPASMQADECVTDCPPEPTDPGSDGDEVDASTPMDGAGDAGSPPVEPDLCPDHDGKNDPGVCGCGTPDTDTDSDGVPDCVDLCPSDPGKTAAGQCGCGVPDTDRDADGTLDCNESCPDDPLKLEAGRCGCGSEDLTDDPDYETSKRESCEDWSGYNCFAAAEEWQYSEAEEREILNSCAETCRYCP